MEKLKKILASTKTTIILFIIILVLSLICKETVVYRFETLASYLYGTDADNKGKLLSTILTAIGGVCDMGIMVE
ncbi:unknown [Bacteroides sp. CAG:443]|nr:unknown [Bacteroides sp. CAG:443]